MKHNEIDEWGLSIPNIGASKEIWSRYIEARELKQFSRYLWLRSARREKGQNDEPAVSADTAGSSKQNSILFIEKDSVLLSPEYKQLLADQLVGLGLSRLKTTDWLANMIYPYLEQGGKIFDGNGNEFIVDDWTIDASYFGDQAFSFNSDIKRFANRKPKRRSPKRLLTRMKLFNVAFKINALNSPQYQIAVFNGSENSQCSLCAANDQIGRLLS